MTNEQARIQQWMKAFGQSTPSEPTIPSLEIRKLRAKLILEEALETIKALGFIVIESCSSDKHLTLQSWIVKQGHEPVTIEPNLIDIIDGCEDLKVVTEGTLVACGCAHDDSILSNPQSRMDMHFEEVMRANEGKLWSVKEIEDTFDSDLMETGIHRKTKEVWITKNILIDGKTLPVWKYLVKDPSGKIIKPPSFTPPDHQKILDERKV